MDTTSQLQQTKHTLPNERLSLTTQDDYLNSRSAVEAMKAWLRACDAHHKEIIDAAKATLDTAKRKADEARHDVAQLLDQYVGEQKRFLTQQRADDEKQIADAAAAIVQSRNEALAKSAVEAAQSGDIDQAAKLFQAAESKSLSFTPEAPRLEDTTTNWTYEVIDVTKLLDEYVNLSPNRGKIREMVIKHHEKAEELVGVGSIIVNKNVSPRYARS